MVLKFGDPKEFDLLTAVSIFKRLILEGRRSVAARNTLVLIFFARIDIKASVEGCFRR